jgi:hypothetical protein
MILTPIQVIPPSPEIGASARARRNAVPHPQELPAGVAASRFGGHSANRSWVPCGVCIGD